jgi:hypothetical protein
VLLRVTSVAVTPLIPPGRLHACTRFHRAARSCLPLAGNALIGQSDAGEIKRPPRARSGRLRLHARSRRACLTIVRERCGPRYRGPAPSKKRQAHVPEKEGGHGGTSFRMDGGPLWGVPRFCPPNEGGRGCHRRPYEREQLRRAEAIAAPASKHENLVMSAKNPVGDNEKATTVVADDWEETLKRIGGSQSDDWNHVLGNQALQSLHDQS